MRHRVVARTLSLAFSLLGLFAVQLAAQDSQDTSVADAARRAREQKKSSAAPAKVITNESLPGAPKQDSAPPPGTQPGPSTETHTQPPPSPDAAPTPPSHPQAVSAQPAALASDHAPVSAAVPDLNPPAAQPTTTPQAREAQVKPEVAALKQQLVDQQKQVDLLMRLHALDQEAFLTNPDHDKDPQGKAKLDAQQEELRAKVAEVARLKEKLDAIAPGESAKVVAPKH